MRPFGFFSALCAVVMASVVAFVAGAARAQPGSLVVAGHGFGLPRLSEDGTKLAFEDQDLPPARSVAVTDLVSGTKTRAATAADGTVANASSSKPSLSSDGARVAFVSFATNLDASASPGIFVKDLGDGSITKVALPATPNVQVALSGNGQRVAFTTDERLSTNDTDPDTDVYVKDLATGTFTLASHPLTSPTPGAFYAGSFPQASMSDDGSKVLFLACPVTDEDPHPPCEVWVKDLSSGTATLLALPPGRPGDARISGDGAHAAVMIGNAGTVQVWALDLLTGDPTLASAADDGTAAAGFTTQLSSISTDGTRVAFTSGATNLDPADTDAVNDVYVKDLPTGDLQLASVTAGGVKGNGGTSGTGSPFGFGGAPAAGLSGDGTRVAFFTNATNLGATPANANDYFVYVKELAPFGVCSDCDGDGIQDTVDTDGGTGADPPGFSNVVQGKATPTTGTVVSGSVTVVDLADQTKGVRITAVTASVLTVCADGLELDLPAGTSLTLTCSSVSVEDITGGTATVVVPNVGSVAFPPGTAGTVSTAGGLRITGVSGTGVTVTIGGVVAPVPPGASNVIQGGPGGNTINGTAGNDVIVDVGGSNTIKGGAGNDSIAAGPGNDTIDGGDGDDTINAGSGNNSIKGGAGNDSITAGPGNDSVDGGAGADRCNADGGKNSVKNCEGSV
jgi:Tol biopolymer transport system component